MKERVCSLLSDDRQKGFTLIEVLLSSALISIIALSIYLVFSQGLNIEERLQARSLIGQDFFGSLYRITSDLENMVPYTFSETKAIYLKGQHDRITFLTLEGSALKEVSYEFLAPEDVKVHRVEVNREKRKNGKSFTSFRQEEEDRRYLLVRKVRPFLNTDPSGDVERQEILSRGLKEDGLNFFYLDMDSQGNERWEEQWQKQSWPIAIRIDLKMLGMKGEDLRMVRDVFIPMGTVTEKEEKEE